MKRVAVLRGGPSEEYSVSLVTGSAVLDALKQLDYPYKDVVITKQGEWLEGGYVRQPNNVLDTVDVVFVALHGQYGEDGQVQRILQRKGVPFTGSRAMPSAIAFNKELTKRSLAEHDILMPRHRRLTPEDLNNINDVVLDIFTDVGDELFVKPVANGSSLGARYAPNGESLRRALKELLAYYDQVLVEEYIRGREATVGVLDNFRGKQYYSLPVVEIVPPQGEVMFSHENKYNGATDEIVPGRFSPLEKEKLSDASINAHKIINCKDYSRSDFIVKDGEVYYLETNTLPGLTPQSLYPKAAEAVGLEFPHLIKHLIDNARV